MSHIGAVDENGDPRLNIRVRGPGGVILNISAVVDTGFGGAVVLGMEAIGQLGLELRDRGVFTLADGTNKAVNTYAADVEWFGRWRRFGVVAMEGGPLAGMILLGGRRLLVDAVEGGEVRVEPIRNSA